MSISIWLQHMHTYTYTRTHAHLHIHTYPCTLYTYTRTRAHTHFAPVQDAWRVYHHRARQELRTFTLDQIYRWHTYQRGGGEGFKRNCSGIYSFFAFTPCFIQFLSIYALFRVWKKGMSKPFHIVIFSIIGFRQKKFMADVIIFTVASIASLFRNWHIYFLKMKEN